jgi:hypothetical protein
MILLQACRDSIYSILLSLPQAPSLPHDKLFLCLHFIFPLSDLDLWAYVYTIHTGINIIQVPADVGKEISLGFPSEELLLLAFPPPASTFFRPEHGPLEASAGQLSATAK